MNETLAIRTGTRRSTASTSDARPGHRLLLTDTRIVPVGPADPVDAEAHEDLARHLGRLGPCPTGGLGLLERVEHTGLTGHGGAHVPTGLKWRRALQAGYPVTVVANAAESEPLSGKDGTLMRQRPHLVLDGLALTTQTLHAGRVVVWLHGDDVGAHQALDRALLERRGWGVPDPRVEIVRGPTHYLAGESSAIIHALNGGPALPTARRPEQTRSTTLVQNVETLARVALLARGIPVTSTLLTLVTPTGREVVEAEQSERIGDLVLRGWQDGPEQAVLVGGYGGTWATWDRVASLPADPGAFTAARLALGAGVIAPLLPGACGLAETAAITRYLASMSARQCGPCLFGLPALAQSMAVLAAGTAPRGGLERLMADVRAVEGRGACRHPDGATRLVTSAVTVFAADLARHAAGRACPGSARARLLGAGAGR